MDFAWYVVECSSHRPVTTAICKTQSRADGARFAYGQRFFSPVVYSIEQRTARTNGHEMEGRGERARQGGQSERASERVRGRMRAWAKRRMLDSRPQEASIRVETCAGECRCRDADARTLIWLRVTWNERTCPVQGKREAGRGGWVRRGQGERERGGEGGRPVREREEEDRIRLVDKTGGEIMVVEEQRGRILHKPGEKRRAWHGRHAARRWPDTTPHRALGVTDKERLSSAPLVVLAETTGEKHRLSKRAPAALVSPGLVFLAGPRLKFEGNRPGPCSLRYVRAIEKD